MTHILEMMCHVFKIGFCSNPRDFQKNGHETGNLAMDQYLYIPFLGG